MATLTAPDTLNYAPSPCHPVEAGTPLAPPPGPAQSGLAQTLAFGLDPYGYALANEGRYGDTWSMRLAIRPEVHLTTSHPDHIKAVFTANPSDAPSLTGESPLRPIVGPNSVLTLLGDEHMRQRKLLLPAFHGDMVARYIEMIERVVEREIDGWKPGSSFALAPRMQAVTLEVIMRGVLGFEEPGSWRTPQRRFREAIRFFLNASNNVAYQLAELATIRRTEPSGALKLFAATVDRELYPLIKQRRAEGEDPSRRDVFSMLLAARDEQGQPMTDQELRDELLSLILAGHETTANSLAWTFERLIRNPEPYAKLKGLVRDGDAQAADAYVEATIHEGMRVRPVISLVVRRAERPWRFGQYVVGAGTPVVLSIIGVHHRHDVYADPYRFNPDRFLDADGTFTKPGTYTWIPFGGGVRRCLGATLAMAEQRVALRQIARRVDFKLTDARGELARQRNVTSIPSHGGRVTILNRS